MLALAVAMPVERLVEDADDPPLLRERRNRNRQCFELIGMLIARADQYRFASHVPSH